MRILSRIPSPTAAHRNPGLIWRPARLSSSLSLPADLGMVMGKELFPSKYGGRGNAGHDQDAGGLFPQNIGVVSNSNFRAWKIWNMMSSPKWKSSTSRRAVINTIGWTGIPFLLLGFTFIFQYGLPSFLGSSLVSEPELGCSSQVSKDGKISCQGLALPLSNTVLTDFSPLVSKLLDELMENRKLAESGENQPYTQEEKETWERKHPCLARAELPPLYARRKVVPDAPPNPQWAAVFEEYAHLHRACMRKVGSIIVDVFDEKRIIPGCKFMTGESLFGLGNKITYAASLLLYAVIAKRVVLFPESTAPWIMCEPFEGSFWTLPQSLEHLNRRTQANGINDGVNSNSTDSFLAWVDAAEGSTGSAVANQGFFHAEADDGWHPVNRFYCDTEQKFLSEVQWVSAAGCLYFLPKIYTIPSFRPTLEALFPQPGLTLTYIMRSAFLPRDEAWDRIQRIYAMQLVNADRRVSIQARYRGGRSEHEQYSPHVNAHITKCLQENAILPNVTEYSAGRLASSSPPFPIVKVMITSLYTDLHDHLNDIYLRHSTVTGESVGLVQVSHEGEQGYGNEVDIQALVEIICLSLSDVILVTPLSTFGGAAQVYGALTPWIIEFNDQEDATCVRAPSVDLCYQLDEDHSFLSCSYDPSVNGTHVMEMASYIQHCAPIESKTGILLLSD